MKSCFFISVLLLFKAFELVAQSWAPVGARWTYNFTDYSAYPGWTSFTSIADHLEVKKDTVINGVLATKIEGGLDCGSTSIAFTYESNGIVYFYNEGLSAFLPYFDFNLTVGDSFEMFIPFHPHMQSMSNEPSLHLRVDSAKIITVNNLPLRSLYVRQTDLPTSFNFFGWFTERIGPGYSFFPIYGACDPPTAGFRCYSDPQFGAYKPGPFQDCDSTYSWVVGVEDHAMEQPKIIVEDDHILVKTTEKKDMLIYTINGLIMFQGTLMNGENFISSNNWSSGVYLVRFGDEYKPVKLFIR